SGCGCRFLWWRRRWWRCLMWFLWRSTSGCGCVWGCGCCGVWWVWCGVCCLWVLLLGCGGWGLFVLAWVYGVF
ncbi:hypothetical protein RA276_28340, partial [Pseudomonas syringae pv. tagetis]|uniref:hypothetical protein n=1 Tax=Pseudomonas syringae group genomosp. 7 TaxID=251699 RepID=UPI0037704859